MATSSYPGTYIQEVPSSRSIQGASTSTPAFIGVTESGPTETPVLITSWAEYQRHFGSLVWYGMVPWSVYEFFLEGGMACYVVRTVDSGSGRVATAQVLSTTFNAATPGVWGNALFVMISDANPIPSETENAVFAVSILVDKDVLDHATALPNHLLKEYVVSNHSPLQNDQNRSYYVLEHFSGFTAQSMVTTSPNQYCALANTINASSMFVRVAASSDISAAVRPANSEPIAFTDGVLPYYNFSGSVDLLAELRDVSLLSIPDITTATDRNGQQTQAFQASLINAALLFCEQQGNLFYVIDPPWGLDVQGMAAFKTGQARSPDGNTNALQSAFGAIYYPWVFIFNPIAGANVPLPPSGPVLGRYANTDATVGVFQSAAGISEGSLMTVVALDQSLTDTDQDQLNPNGINALRNFPNYGNLIWGARTLSLNTEWTYIATRRLLIYVEQSLKQSLQWVVFEPNSTQLWMAVTGEINAFLTSLWQQGGLLGSTQAQAFFVICDASNNPPDTRILGQLNIDIGLAVQHPAEFIVFRMTQAMSTPD